MEKFALRNKILNYCKELIELHIAMHNINEKYEYKITPASEKSMGMLEIHGNVVVIINQVVRIADALPNLLSILTKDINGNIYIRIY